MSVIDDLVKKLKTAQRVEKTARHALETSERETALCRSELCQKAAVVAELESAISLLRNGLKTRTTEIGNVTPIRK